MLYYKLCLKQARNKGVALIIVLAFVVLLSGLVVAYFSRTSTDRQLARSSFENTTTEILVRSALEIIVGDFKQEIANGSSGSGPFTPNGNDDIVPTRTGNPADVPNLIRRSWSSDVNLPVRSRASNVNSTSVSANRRSVSTARWNKHYLIPRLNAGSTTVDTTPVNSFVAPDWVFVNDQGPTVITSPNNSVIGRYAYAVYDEGGLLDLNVAGFPSVNSSDTTYTTTRGRKGVLAFADLTATGLSAVAIDNLIGWRNYLSGQPAGGYKSFSFPSNPTSFVNYFLDAVRDFGVASIPAAYSNSSGVDQSFINRTALLELRQSLLAKQDAMQYLGTFSRESNHSTWSNSETVLAGRFPLGRFDLFTNPATNAAAIQQYFGLTYVAASAPTAEHWQYVGASGSTLLSSIPPISGNNQNPDLFPLLQYALPSATVDEILSIGASLIDQRDVNGDTTWIEFGDSAVPQKAFGVDRNASTEVDAPPQPANVVVLNRSFRNVGELGYAYRNGSTSLDFRTAGNSDAPLLDLFTYNTAAPRSGIVNLNTQNPGVVAAVLMGAITTEGSSSAVTQAEATTAANTIVTATAAQPAVGRHDVADIAGVVTSAPFSTNEETNETVTRALAEVGQTRTWGLLIDVIAQSGRYRVGAATMADFVVQSEKRYWLHVAIDRFTGKIIDQQLEAVYE